ncbi:MAG TPA: phosphatidate cytidylyltransferase [Porphyromonadaceae bacterium]|nr:phosphatidate cytidylyltransferase [Porphyromonadaceae bacterium]HBL34159.1 phosphatidate cytidylyltransferase [Porphyromonadaceae bacterium]HBX20445.1 phosphatidate cytidylyltransferase [Porphyromonadaceae bacterium]HCM19870.1 phosphatidate cytidylyltransferase [Porphyromonadaceae bacterium]
MNIKDLVIRAGAGAIYVLLVLFGILGGRFSFVVVFGCITAVALYEFYRMMEKNTSHAISKILNITAGVAIFLSVYFYLEGICLYALSATIFVYLLALFASAIFIRRNDILYAIIYSVFGQIYITLPMSLLMLISYRYNMVFSGYHYASVLAIFVFLWVNDTAAYFLGSLFGKHKLIDRISPKKSIEGFIAGIVFTVIASFIFAHQYPLFSYWIWIIFALITSLAGTLGDLFESLIKRTCEVKDSGTLIPGHGGILDRIDSLLIAIPAVYLFLITFHSF